MGDLLQFRHPDAMTCPGCNVPVPKITGLRLSCDDGVVGKVRVIYDMTCECGIELEVEDVLEPEDE